MILHAGNLLGALMLVGLASLGGVLAAAPDGPMSIAAYKCSHSFLQARQGPCTKHVNAHQRMCQAADVEAIRCLIWTPVMDSWS